MVSWLHFRILPIHNSKWTSGSYQVLNRVPPPKYKGEKCQPVEFYLGWLLWRPRKRVLLQRRKYSKDLAFLVERTDIPTPPQNPNPTSSLGVNVTDRPPTGNWPVTSRGDISVGRSVDLYQAIDFWQDIPYYRKDLNTFSFANKVKRYFLSEQHCVSTLNRNSSICLNEVVISTLTIKYGFFLSCRSFK